MSWCWLRYNNVKQPLALTDKDWLSNVQEPQSVPDGKYWALQMEFTLPTSTYATMALREVLRCDTSSAYQSTLNQEWGLAVVEKLQYMYVSFRVSFNSIAGRVKNRHFVWLGWSRLFQAFGWSRRKPTNWIDEDNSTFVLFLTQKLWTVELNRTRPTDVPVT